MFECNIYESSPFLIYVFIHAYKTSVYGVFQKLLLLWIRRFHITERILLRGKKKNIQIKGIYILIILEDVKQS